jgi:hypothetical protein
MTGTLMIMMDVVALEPLRLDSFEMEHLLMSAMSEETVLKIPQRHAMMAIQAVMMVAVALALLRMDILAMKHLLLFARSEEVVSKKEQRIEMMGTLLMVTVAVVLVPLRLGLHVILLLIQRLAFLFLLK